MRRRESTSTSTTRSIRRQNNQLLKGGVGEERERIHGGGTVWVAVIIKTSIHRNRECGKKSECAKKNTRIEETARSPLRTDFFSGGIKGLNAMRRGPAAEVPEHSLIGR